MKKPFKNIINISKLGFYTTVVFLPLNMLYASEFEICKNSSLTEFEISSIGEKINVLQTVIEGKIIDEKGLPIPGATIIEKGTNNSTITDFDGKFKMNVSKGGTLEISFIGYSTQTIKINEQTHLTIRLVPSTQSLDEVVVVGYGTTTKRNLTTAVSSIKTDDIPKSANNSVNQLLFGRAAGLNVTQQSAEPGGAINLSIRGKGNPLVIVDGIVVPTNSLEPGSGIGEINGVSRGGLQDLNPADIESIEILKDASAAIYGVAAADGVVLITTKKGKEGRMIVTYDASHSLVNNMPYMTPVGPQDYMRYYNIFNKDKYLLANNMIPYGSNAASGYTPKFSEQDINNQGVGTDWLGKILRDGSVDNHNLTVKGGSDKINYYFSSSYFNQTGTIENSGLKKYSARTNLTFRFSDRIKLNTSLNYTRNSYENSTAGAQTGGSGTQGFGALQAALSYPTYLPIYDESGIYTLFSTTGNPISLLNIKGGTKAIGIMANVSLDIDIIPKMLTAKLLYGNNYENSQRSMFIPSDVFWGQIYQSRGSLGNAYRQNQTLEATMSFKKDFFKDAVHFDGVLGTGEYIYDDNGDSITATDMLDAIGTDNIGAAPTILSISSYKNFEKKRSYFTRANFDILDRYLVSLVYRYDGIDKFFPDNKYAGFPSASVGWKISNEKFLSTFNNLSLLKVRASIGITGRPIGSAAYGQYSPDADQPYFNGGSTIYTPYYETRINQPELKWEKTRNTNIGLDFGFFKNRISGSFDIFSDNITNLLTSRSTDQLSYLATAFKNDGSTERSGWEFSLKSVNFSVPDFQWDMLVNLSHYDYKWKKRFENQDLQSFVGEHDPVNAIYAFETNGIIQIGETPSAWQPAGAQLPGSPKFVDVNGDQVLDNKDVKMFRRDPKLIVGLGNNFKYKNWDLSAFFYAQFGANDFNNTLLWADPNGIAGGAMGATTEIKNVWSTENPNGIYPGVAFNESVLSLPTSIDTRLSKKDFVRCRNITLGYTFKDEYLKKMISKLRVYFDVQNPFIITNYKGGGDPENLAQGVKGAPAPYPMATTFSLGANITF